MLGDMIHAFKIFKVVALSRVYALTKSSQVAQSCPTVAYQAPLSMGFSRQEYWSGFPYALTTKV